jgi:acyl-[acyl-carrier-protein]-phospholipid O-acyltransferase/long-chain-fatty-acid--[acyl-carrier-protein] ligase
VGIANLVAGVAVMAVLPTSGFRDFLSIVFRAR